MVPREAREILLANRPDIDDVRWVKPEKCHITFEYFADLANELIDEVHHKVVTLSKYFPLECEALRFSGFPSDRRARVIVALLSLANIDVGSVCDNRKFTPHVTVGYARTRRVFVPRTSLDLQFSFDRPALFLSEKGVYHEIAFGNREYNRKSGRNCR